MPLRRPAARATLRTDTFTARAKKAIHLAQEEAQRGSAPLSNGPSTAPARRHRTLVTSLLSPARGKAIDALVAAGIRSTRSDAAAWLIRSGIEANREFFEQVYATVSEIRRLREQAQALARQSPSD